MPAFTAVGAYVAGTVFGLVGTAAVVVGALVATGAAYITSRIINGNPNKGNNSAAGSQGGRIQVPPATNNKIPVLYGNAYVNGIITDARLYTLEQKQNDLMYYCIVLSETCNDATAVYTVDDVYWNDLRLTYLTDTYETHIVKDGRKTVDGPGEDFVDTNFIVDTNRFVEMRIYAGGTEAADQIFPPQSSLNKTPAYQFWGSTPANPNGDGTWTSRNEMKGLVYAIVRVRYNGEKGFTGLPNVTFKLNNTVSNPADVWEDYMTGQRYGANINASYIDTTAQTAWKNFCDEDIVFTDKDGTANQYTSRYSINGLIDTSRPVKENIDIIMQNGGAWLSYDVSTGLWSPIIKKAVSAGELGLPATYFTASRTSNTLTVTNFPAGRIEAGQLLYNSSGTLIGTIVSQTTPTAGETAGQLGTYTTSAGPDIGSTTFYTLPPTMLSFTDDNIISGISISSTRLDDLYNSYEAEFYDKFNKDQKAYSRDAIQASERNPNEPDNQLRLSLDLCNNSVQASLLSKLELAQSRDDLVVEFTSNFYGIQAQAGDVISIYSELYDWAPKYFRIMRVKEQETEEGGLVAQIQALEYNPDVYTIEPLTEFTTSANIGIGVYGASPNLPPPPDVIIAAIDADAPIPNFQLQIEIPSSGGPFDEIELFYTEGWDQHPVTGSIVPGTGSNGAAVGQGLLTVTATTYGNINAGDRIDLPSDIFIVSQLTNSPASKTFVSGGVPASTTSTLLTLNNVTGLIVGNTLTGTGIANGSFIIEIDSGTNTVRIEDAVTVQAAGTYTVSGGLGTYVVDTSTTISGTADLYDFPEADNYKLLKKIVPEGNTATFTNGEIIRDVITNVPANSATYRRWFVKARMGIKKRFGAFSSPGDVDFTQGRFPYNPNPSGGGGGGGALPGVFSSVDINNTTPWLTFSTQPDGVNPKHGIRGRSTQDDYWFVGGASAGDDLGYLELATADNAGGSNSGGEIYVRQYNGAGAGGPEWVTGGTGTAQRTLTLLDNLGNTTIPQNLTVDSGTLFVDATNNRVGINDITPSYSLDVTGDANITSNLTVDSGTLFVDATNNRVGINNTSPSYELYVNSAEAGPNDNVQFAMNNTERTFILSNDAATNLLSFYYVANRLQFDLTDQWFNTGKLGINNSSPGYTLDVTGDARITLDAVISGDLTVNGTTSGGAVADITTTNTSGAIFNTNATTLDIGGAASTFNLGANSGTMTIGNPTVVGTQTTQNLYNSVATTLNIGGASTATNIGSTASGTTTIGYDLFVNRSANIETSLTVPSISTLTGDDLNITAFSGRDVTISTTAATDPVTIVRNTTATNTAVRTLTLRLDSTGTPAIGFGNSIEFETETTPGTTVQTGFITNKSTGDNAGVLDEFEMSFGVMSAGVSTERMVLDNLGNLQIDGDLTVTGNDIKSSSATAITLSGDDVAVVGGLNVNSGVLYVDKTNNRVGVNNTSPTKDLDVTGEAKISSEVTIGNTSTFSNVNYQEVRFETYNFNAITSVPTNVGIDLFVKATYRSARYSITMTKGSDYQVINLTIIHDGTTAYLSQSDDIKTGASDLATFSVSVDATHVVLTANVNGTVNFKWWRWLTEVN